ncbi:MAG TPA: YafY family protein [Ktedonobacteraceae bacterium]|jgi:predicted DNA-binding transcriptional regulator YafY
MYHPISRVLTVLELLQSRPAITGPELAARLEMDVRTVRRYITHLQDVGIPVEANIGRYGGYRLRPGFKLPPLMLSEEEATAVVLGLLASTWLGVEQSPIAIEGALAKVSRVLPPRAREHLETIASQLVLFPRDQPARPNASLLINLSEAIGQHQRIAVDYRSYHDQVTQRKVEPYSVMGRDGHWYLIGYCCLRQDFRMFRLDRIQHVTLLAESFERAAHFDCRAYLEERYRKAPGGIYIEVEFQAAIYTVQQKIPPSFGQLSATPTGTLFQSQYEDIDAIARYLVALDLPFIVHDPPALCEALLHLAEQMTQIVADSRRRAHNAINIAEEA